MSDLPENIRIYKEGLIGKADAAKYRKEYLMDELDKGKKGGSVIVQFGPKTKVTDIFLKAFFWKTFEAGKRVGFSKRVEDMSGVLTQVEGGMYQLVRHSKQTDKQFAEIWHGMVNLGIGYAAHLSRKEQNPPSPS